MVATCQLPSLPSAPVPHVPMRRSRDTNCPGYPAMHVPFLPPSGRGPIESMGCPPTSPVPRVSAPTGAYAPPPQPPCAADGGATSATVDCSFAMQRRWPLPSAITPGTLTAICHKYGAVRSQHKLCTDGSRNTHCLCCPARRRQAPPPLGFQVGIMPLGRVIILLPFGCCESKSHRCGQIYHFIYVAAAECLDLPVFLCAITSP